MSDIKSTKAKILNCANELFATQGFDATSVRDIAAKAEVNIAAINYHFKNKEGLFLEIFRFNYAQMDQDISAIAHSEDLTTKEMSVKLFQYFIDNKKGLLNTFRMILSDKLHQSQDPEEDQQMIGPPGWESLLEIISKDVGSKLPPEPKFWAMEMMFSTIVHMATIMSSSYFSEYCTQVPLMTPKQKEFELGLLAEALINYIKKEGQNWKGPKMPDIPGYNNLHV